MTLILSCLTPDYVVQVSDRRLTFASPPQRRGAVSSEHANKAIWVQNQLIFGFTGLAEINGLGADVWFARQIAEMVGLPLQDAIRQVATNLSAEMRKFPVRYRHLTRHAFIGIGWTHLDRDPAIRPIQLQISNFLDADGGATNLMDLFSIYLRTLKRGESVLLTSAGASVDGGTLFELRLNLRKCVRADAGPNAIARLLSETIWKIHKRDPTVGKRLMICSFPKPAAERYDQTGQILAMATDPQRTQATFLYVDHEDASSVQFGPVSVADGVVMSNFISNTPDDVNVSIYASERLKEIHRELRLRGIQSPDDQV